MAAVSALALLPVVLGRVGLAAYGTITLANSAVTLLQFFDGGMLNAVTRYAGLAFGAQDRVALTRYVTTASTLSLSLGGLLGLGLFLLAPEIVSSFQIDAVLKPQAVYAARVVAIMLPLGLLQGILSGVLTASARFGALAAVSILTRLWYVVAVITLLTHSDGIRTMMLILLAQQCGGVALVCALSLPSLRLRAVRLLPAAGVREMLAYSLRVQAFALSGLVNLQADTFIVGAVLPVRYVGLFGIGSTVANQIRSLPANVSGPLVARLTNTLGASGEAAAAKEFGRLQRIWTVWVTGFACVATGVVGCCIYDWLGGDYKPAAIVATVLLAGAGLNLLTIPLSLYLQAIGRPQIEVRYGWLSAGLNLLLTAALLWTGLYGITGATAVGVGVGSLTFVPLARAGVSGDLPSFLDGAPWRAGIAAGLASAATGLLIVAALPPSGVVGLILTGLAVGPGACVFLTVLLGPRHLSHTVRAVVRARSLGPCVAAISARSVRP